MKEEKEREEEGRGLPVPIPPYADETERREQRVTKFLFPDVFTLQARAIIPGGIIVKIRGGKSLVGQDLCIN